MSRQGVLPGFSGESQIAHPTPPPGGAVFSPCGRYRYRLWRRWAPGGECILWVMLNPSTACATEDDPTIRRCVGFAKAWGAHAMEVVNLFAWRATDPRELVRPEDPVGPANDEHILLASARASRTIVAWGADPFAVRRAKAVLERLSAPQALALTKSGAPRHPLYLRRDLVPRPYLLPGETRRP